MINYYVIVEYIGKDLLKNSKTVIVPSRKKIKMNQISERIKESMYGYEITKLSLIR